MGSCGTSKVCAGLISYGSEKSGHFLKLENESNSPVFEESNFEEREKKKEGKKKKEEKKKEREEEKKEYIFVHRIATDTAFNAAYSTLCYYLQNA
ncbi:hypothetical protein RIR_jg32617.t2 [Rhizophagus irregularis DAOM 181602=DAOM 197198]|nr:hypothetical protein RIR_jg32617.t2 [Rhizophagus irregularis DAOM 181602=DAOM 197198]